MHTHQTRCLQLKRVRTYLLAHPGSTCAEVTKAVGRGLVELQMKGLAKWRKIGGATCWYAVTNQVSRPWTESYTEREYEESGYTTP